jgi:hypothetical protein
MTEHVKSAQERWGGPDLRFAQAAYAIRVSGGRGGGDLQAGAIRDDVGRGGESWMEVALRAAFCARF